MHASVLNFEYVSIPVPITAIVTAYQRIDQTLSTLRELQNCQPPPAEILVHVDGNQTDCVGAIRATFPSVRVFVSEGNVGPGGGRNKLVAAAEFEFVASFDDDSYPHDPDFFGRVVSAAEEFPNAAVYSAGIYHQGESPPDPSAANMEHADFGGGGCVFSRGAFLEAGGYVPLPIAYGMEEVDLALRLHAMGRRVIRIPRLRVFHDTVLERHAAPSVTAGSIANIALLAFLRYPVSWWPMGLVQILNRVRWLVLHRRFAGILSGLCQIPPHCWQHRNYRKPVPANRLRTYLALRRKPVAPE